MQVAPLPDAEPVHETLAPEPEPEPKRLYLHMPIDVRSVSLAVVALMLSIFMLHWASAVFIPLLLGVMSSYALSPAVERMQRCHIPRALGAAVLLTAVVGGLGSMLYSLSDDATALVDSLPDAAQKLREAVRAAAADTPAAVPGIAAVLVVRHLPVDIRHNSKIDRVAVGHWAQRVLDGRRPGTP